MSPEQLGPISSHRKLARRLWLISYGVDETTAPGASKEATRLSEKLWDWIHGLSREPIGPLEVEILIFLHTHERQDP